MQYYISDPDSRGRWLIDASEKGNVRYFFARTHADVYVIVPTQYANRNQVVLTFIWLLPHPFSRSQSSLSCPRPRSPPHLRTLDILLHTGGKICKSCMLQQQSRVQGLLRCTEVGPFGLFKPHRPDFNPIDFQRRGADV
jgi:hypothetical protein